MHLKGLKIQGFKSFADPIELNFSQGITAIVGPNGSGKSNIADAVRWVLGEQSAKTLRGSKMEDVIFNGTEQRKRLGFAEVTLKLDNHDHYFHVNFDEISVTRKVFASGESQYFMNDVPCRLKDIHEIFMDTGLGRDGYSMVGQGKIDEILSTKSEDRRDIFEEAAGISKYRYRREEAERRLKHTDENLDRVADIIKELEMQLEPLSQQAEKAKKYLNLRDQLKVYDVNAALSVIEKSHTQTTSLTEKIEAASAQLATNDRALSAVDLAQEACYTEFEQIDAAIASEETALQSVEENLIVSEREIEVLQSTIEGNLRLLERIEKETADLLAGKLASEQDLAKQLERIKELEAELSALATEKAALGEQLATFDQNQGCKTGDLERHKQEIASLFETISDCKIKLSNFELLEMNVKTTLRTREQGLFKKEQELAQEREKSGYLGSEFEQKETVLQDLDTQLAAAKEKETILQETIDQIKAQGDKLKQEINQKKTRLHLLSEMEQNFEGYYKSVRELMKQHAEGRLVGIHGPVSKLLQISKPYATAIGSALSGALQNIVVDREEDAKAAINCLKRSGAGRATFMPISAVSGSLLDVSKLKHESGYVGLASELIRYDKTYEGVVRNLLGKTVVVQDTDTAIYLSRKYKQSLKIVTLEGEIFYPGGSIAGGSQQKGNQLLEREQEIAELTESIANIEKKFKSVLKEQMTLEGQILEISQQQDSILDQQQVQKEMILVLSRDREHQGILLTSLAQAIEEDKRSIEEANTELLTLAADKEAVSKLLDQSEREIQEKRQILNELEETFEALANQKQAISDQILERGFAETAKQQEIVREQQHAEELRENIRHVETLMALRSDEIREIKAANQGHQGSQAQKAEQNLVWRKEIEQKSQVICDLTKKRQDSEQRLRSLQAESGTTRETVYQLKTECERLQAQREKLDSEAEAAILRLWDEYELTYSEATVLKQELGADSNIARQIASLRGRIRELGNVNVDAIEELKIVEERYEFLTRQRDDLNKAKRDLLHIIQEMQTIMKRQFKEEFQKISQHFKTTFAELFGGGRADLRLEDEENVLDCGIEINVQPPGKKLQSLSLLSGGERALSAIALLFAILRIKPTPFCFLDEIEAALDENNVYRYADFIKRFSRNTQFILVTHRRGTMECADRIYGVTMQEKGVSKLLQLNLDEIEG